MFCDYPIHFKQYKVALYLIKDIPITRSTIYQSMEFPTLGEHCQFGACNQTDFLPLQCKCGKVFCREHFNDHCHSGDCELAPKPKEVNLKNDDQIFRCSEKECKKGNLHEMLCPKCNKHFCIEHRFHL